MSRGTTHQPSPGDTISRSLGVAEQTARLLQFLQPPSSRQTQRLGTQPPV